MSLWNVAAIIEIGSFAKHAKMTRSKLNALPSGLSISDVVSHKIGHYWVMISKLLDVRVPITELPM